MVNGHRTRRAAANRELADHRHPPRLQHADQVVQDRVDHRLVEDALITEREEVQFQALHLDAAAVGHVRNRDRSKVRLTRHRAYAGELREDEFDLVVPLGARVRERVEDRARLGLLAVRRRAVTFPQEV